MCVLSFTNEKLGYSQVDQSNLFTFQMSQAPIRFIEDDNLKSSRTETPRPVAHSQFFDDDIIGNSINSIIHPKRSRTTIFSHFSLYRRIWEYLIFFVSVSPVIEISFIMIFVERVQISYYFIFIIFDILFLVDLYVVTHTAYLSHGVLVYEVQKIKNHYTNLSFWIHIIGGLPLSWISIFINNKWAYLILAMNRFLRLRRGVLANCTLKGMLIYHSWVSKLVPSILLIFVVFHAFACSFYLIAKLEGIKNSWIGILGWDYLNRKQLYVVSLYFVLTTILTIGFGDNTPKTSSEVILVIFIQLVGVFGNSYILGMFVSFLLDDEESEFLYHYASLVDFLKFKKVPKSQRMEVYHYFQNKWEKTKGSVDPNDVYKFIPETIRTHLKYNICEKCLLEVSMFQLSSKHLRDRIANVLIPKEYIPGEVIITQGEISPNLILLNSGIIEVYIDGTKTITASCNNGKFYGDLELVVDLPRRSTIKAFSHVTGWELPRTVFQYTIGLDPGLKKEMLENFKELYPEYYKYCRKILSMTEIKQIQLSMLSSSESDSDVVTNMRNSSDETSDFQML